MIDWGVLADKAKSDEKIHNPPESGETPHTSGGIPQDVGKDKPISTNGFKDISPLSPLSPRLFPGAGNNEEINAPGEGWLQIIFAMQKRILLIQLH